MEELICPICKKGKMIEGESSFTCNYFKSIDDKCSFIVWKEQHGIEVGHEVLQQLCQNLKTEILALKTKEGKPYKARLVVDVEHGSVYSASDQGIIENDHVKCPKCGAQLNELPLSYKCENEKCDFNLFKNIAGHILSVDELEDIFVNGKSDFFDFESKRVKVFTVALRFDENYNLVFDNEVCKCPVCDDGIIKSWNTNYSCTNQDFTIWKNQNGAVNMTVKDAVQLCNDRETRTLNFKSKEGNEYKGKLVLNDDNKIITVK